MPPPQIPLTDLVVNGTPIFPHEAAAVVQEVCAFLAGQKIRPRAVPALDYLALDPEGRLLPSATVALEEEAVPAHLGRLLRALLDTAGFAAEPAFGQRLQSIADQAAAGTVSVEGFSKGVGRLDPSWRADFLGELYARGARHRESSQPPVTTLATEPVPVEAPADPVAPDAASRRVCGPPRRPASIADFAVLRDGNGVTIDTIAARIKIAPSLLHDLERGTLKRWPGGIYRRGWIRAYASEAGLDSGAVLRLLAAELDAPDEQPVPSPQAPAADASRRSLLHRLAGLF